MPELFIARQPIYNRTQHVYGYELLYRPARDERDAEGDAATSQVIINTMTEIGLENLVGTRAAFVNLTRSFVTGRYPLPLPPNRVVIEILEDIEVDEELLTGVQLLVDAGYTIALDDFIYHQSMLPLLELVHIVKIDVQALDEKDLRAHVHALREYPHLKLLAEKVEIPEEYELCRELGFDYFQGYFFSRPKVIRRPRLPANQLALMQLLAEVQRPDTTIPKLEMLISQDVGFSYKLLRYINSAFFAMPKPVESIQRAVVLLGTKVIQKWITLLVLARVEDKPAELMVTAVVRAKMCEILAKALRYEAEDTCFTVGLLSVLEALLDMPMEKVLGMLTLTDEVNRALLRFEGTPGKLLQLALHYEYGEWDRLEHPALEEEVILDAYLQAIAWATEASRNLLGE